ncbi:poly a -specific ribonuclease/target of egr1 member 1 [Holotrichia oblita]|uniref:Poly a -specific ribonuclease/target of egr1 member 1 n=1 Tax=Holotrichia oblita TaxID=644536 RepID=A0ACB9T3Y5_HOLOL|nr:poly a -specific ribonuclease/target of egr1 member 1 [Holotrichia oblita]
MCEVTIENFNTVLNDVKCSFQKAKFITIDTEFSALNFSEKVSNRLVLFIYKGIPYINRLQETEIRNFQSTLVGNNVSLDDNIFDRLIQEEGTKITKWINNDKGSDKLILHGVFNKYRHSPDILYFFYKHIRNRFNKQLWVMEENGEIVIKRVSPNEFNTLVKESNLEEIVMDNMLGFTKVFRFLIQLKKPLIGHNLLTDIMIMYHRFENPLPKSYNTFKKEIYNLFPIIYDTKCITFDVKKLIPENKMWEHNILEVLYMYFKDGYGRHLALNSPHISLKNQPNHDQFHNAGWDSYCTGYIFIRMAHICAAKKFPMKSKFMCSELFASTDSLKNCVNLIRCSVSHIKLDGNDPVSQRPPCLIIESVKDKPLDLLEVSTYCFKSM